MRPTEDVEVYLCREVVDFRKSINGLSALVEEHLGLNPFGPQLFVFCNRRRDKLKDLVLGAQRLRALVQAPREAPLSLAES